MFRQIKLFSVLANTLDMLLPDGFANDVKPFQK